MNAKLRILRKFAAALLILSIMLNSFPFGLETASALEEATVGGFLYAWDGEKITGAKSNPHDGNGVDFLTPTGAQEYPVLAPKDGVVVDYFDEYPVTLSTCTYEWENRSKFPNYIVLGHGWLGDNKYDHYTLIYHFAQGSISQAGIEIGDWIRLGQVIGTAGTTGASDANHVHMEVSKKEPGLNTSRSYNCNGADIDVAKHRNNWDDDTVSYGFEEQGNQWPVENGAQNTSVGDSFNWTGIQTNNCDQRTNDVILYNHVDFGGECVVVSDPSQAFNVPSGMHISSVYLNPEWTEDHLLTIYNGPNLGGDRWGVLLTSVADLREFNYWNDEIQSTHNSYTGAGWLTEFSITENRPLETNIHVVVEYQGDFDAMRVCFNGENCQETAATELYYTWPTYLETTGDYLISVQYRVDSDNQDWNNADKIEYGYHLVADPSYAPCSSSANGAELTSGSDCVKVTSNVLDLASANWADRSNLSITADGVDVLAYDSPDFVGAPYYIRDGQTVSVGNNVSGIELREPLGTSAYVPVEPLGTDANTTAYLPMNEGSGTQVFDSVGSLDGTLAGSASFTTGRFGQAIAAPTSPSISGVNFGAVNLGSPLTVELFVKFNSANNDQRIMTQLGGGGNTGYNKWLLGLVGGRFRVWSCYTNGCHEGYSLENVQTNTWYYLMFTYDGTTTAKLYVNSLYQTTLSMDGTMSPGSTTLEIGKGENINGCDCVIDDVRISNIVREPVMPGVWNGGLVSNGSFETLTSGWADNWTRNNTNSVLIDTGSNGSHGSNSLHFTSDTVNHHAFGGEMAVMYGNSYTWLSHVESTSGSGEFGFYIDEYDSSHNWISGQWFSALPASTEGTKIIRYTPSGSSVAYAGLQYYMTANTSYEVYVDSVSFVQASSNNLVTNGGFEYLLNGWADAWTRDNTNVVTVSTSSQGNEGTNSLHFSPPSNNVHAFAARFPVGSGTYTWSQYVVTTSGTGEFGFYIDEYDANGDWISGQWKGGIWGASSGVQSFTYTRSSSNVAFAAPQLYVTGGTTFDVYVDSVSFGQ